MTDLETDLKLQLANVQARLLQAEIRVNTSYDRERIYTEKSEVLREQINLQKIRIDNAEKNEAQMKELLDSMRTVLEAHGLIPKRKKETDFIKEHVVDGTQENA